MSIIELSHVFITEITLIGFVFFFASNTRE
jgi:hypothetical protein